MEENVIPHEQLRLPRSTNKVVNYLTVFSKLLPHFLLTAGAYFVAAKFSLYLAVHPGNASGIWPPSAIALCAVLVWGKRMLPAVWIAATLANFTSGISPANAVLIGIGNSLEAFFSAVMIQRFLGRSPYFSLGDQVYKFIAIAAASSLISASIGVVDLTSAQYIGHSQMLLNWVTWWLADTTGIIIIAPLILTWNKPPYGNWQLARLAEMALFGALVVTASHIIFKELPAKWAMPYVMLTFVSWAAFRYGLSGVTRTVAIISAVAIYDTAKRVGPFAGFGTLNESLLMLQIFLSILWVVGVAQAVLLEQRARAENALRDERSALELRVKERTVALEKELNEIMRLEQTLKKSEHQLAEAQRLAHLGSWEWNISDNIVYWSDELYRIFGVDKENCRNSLEQYLGLIHPDDLQMTQDVIEKAMETHEPYKFVHRTILPDGSVKTVIGRGFVQSDDSGSAIRMYGTAQDVTDLKATEDLLRETEERYQEVVELSPNGMMIIDESGHPVLANSAAISLCGLATMEELAKKFLFDFLDPGFHDAFRKKIDLLKTTKEAQAFEEKFIRSHGAHLDVEMTITNFVCRSFRAILVIMNDITERKLLDQNLLLAAQVFENSREAILILDKDKNIIRTNDAFSAITGYAAHEVIGDTSKVMRSALYDEAFYQHIWDEVNARDHWQDEVLCQRTDGQSYIASASIVAVRNQDGTIANYIAIFSDITERKEAESRIRFMAEHDFLTRLPSRALLLDRLGQAIAVAKRNGTHLAILFIDLDRFKNINDSMGHTVGDKLLQHIARQLKKCVRGVDTICRQGGDEFIILLTEIGSVEQVAHIAQNVMKVIGLPYKVDQYEINITSSIGISMYPNDGKDIDTLIKNADVAMYHAKQSGRNDYQFFNDKMNARITERIMLENSLKKAIDKNEFILQYQPQMEIDSGRMIGAEALIRWQHPELGLLLPTYFITVAEECGLILPIGDWVLRTACLQAKSWQEKNLPLVVSVNLSVAQFRHKNLFESVLNALTLADLEPQYLELEITESILAEEASNAIVTLIELRELGVKLAIDDFGTGYSSLSYLKRFAVDKLKIDQSFVHDVSSDENDAAITTAIISMAKNLKLKVIAEGVETQAQLGFLKAHGCDEFQGFYLSKALSPCDFTEFRVLH
ncbi:MAG: bifunctional diguanylate cyclase/phosphodiesterase [Burkholderiaceae bacterium]